MKKTLLAVFIVVVALFLTGCEPKEYTVTFETNGGTPIDPVLVLEEALVPRTKTTTKEGHTFDGWYSDETLTTAFDFTSFINEDITLYAGWNLNKFNIAFESNSTTVIEPQTVDYNNTAVEPTEPTKDKHVFGGWYTDPEFTTEFDFSTPITDAYYLYGKWDLDLTDLERATSNMDLLDSFTMTLSVYLESYDIEVESMIWFEGNHLLAEVFGIYSKSVLIDNQEYSIEKLYDLNLLVPASETDINLEYTDFDFFNEADIEYVDGYYEISGDIELLEGITSYKIKEDGTHITEMIIEMDSDDGPLITTISFSNLNTTKITSNFDYVPLDTSLEILTLAETLGVRDAYTDVTSFVVAGDRNLQVQCNYENEICHISSRDYDHFMYHLGYQTVVDEDYGLTTYIPYAEYVDLENNSSLGLELFQFLNTLYPLYKEIEGLD